MFCSQCGSKNNDSCNFCTRCGAPLQQQSNPPQNVNFAQTVPPVPQMPPTPPAPSEPPVHPSKNKKTGLIIAIVSIILVLITVIIILVVMLAGNNTSSQQRLVLSQVVSNQMSPLIDSRDGKIYQTVQIGSQVWMAQNLNYYNSDSWCHGTSNCKNTGRLYTWEAAMQSCPPGWHLPSKREYETLWHAVGGAWIASKNLKSKSGWRLNEEGVDSYGFKAIPAGYIGATGSHAHGSDRADFWTATEFGDEKAYDMDLYGSKENAFMEPDPKSRGFSVRCVKN